MYPFPAFCSPGCGSPPQRHLSDFAGIEKRWPDCQHAVCLADSALVADAEAPACWRRPGGSDSQSPLTAGHNNKDTLMTIDTDGLNVLY